MHSAHKEDSYSIDFAIDTINRAYPGCTGMYLGMAGHMLAFYGKKTNLRAGLLIGQAVTTSKAITNIPTWMGYFARWKVWCVSISEASDLTTLLQMLREHYCGSLTFREQRNTIKNLCQKPQEAAIDFLIRVSTSVSNLGKDWKDKLTDTELQFLQYEVSLNGVQEEIRHVLDSEIAKNGGKWTPQQMYEAVKRYKTYVAHNKRLKGKGASSSTSQPKATGQPYRIQYRVRGYGLISRANYRLASHV